MKKRLVSTLSILILCSVLCSCCCSSSGPSCSDLRNSFVKSNFVQSVERFYPEKSYKDKKLEPYPFIEERDFKTFQKEIEVMQLSLSQAHKKKKARLSKVFPNEALIIPNYKLELVSTMAPFAAVVEENKIELDIRLIQAIYRGSLLEEYRLSQGFTSMGNIFEDDPFVEDRPKKKYVDISKDKIDPKVLTDEQREAIMLLLQKIDKAKSTTCRPILFDALGMLFSDDHEPSPWHKMAGVNLASIQLQLRYASAVLFMLAHEQGHISLNHFNKIKNIVDAQELCVARKRYEVEADLYAYWLLTNDDSQLFIDIMGWSNAANGYNNFFKYGYELAGFSGDSCSYPSNEERLNALIKIDDQASKGVFERLFIQKEETSTRGAF